jgi:hypothetical protein
MLRLEAGDSIVCDLHSGVTAFFEKSDVGNRAVRWKDTDNKTLCEFIRSDMDFASFILFLAEMNGLRVDTITESADGRKIACFK